MFAVAVNALSIVAGSLLGVLFRKSISGVVGNCIRVSMGFITIVIGLKMALKFETVLLLVLCIVLGGVIGTLMQLEKRLDQFADRLSHKVGGSKDSQFPFAFSLSTILYCTGAMAVVGSIQSGISGNHEVLYAKSVLDGITSITFSALYGVGVAFSAIPVFIYQGLIATLAPKIQFLTRPQVINDISGVGGVLVMMIGFNISGVYKVAVGNYFPAVLIVIAGAPFVS